MIATQGSACPVLVRCSAACGRYSGDCTSSSPVYEDDLMEHARFSGGRRSPLLRPGSLPWSLQQFLLWLVLLTAQAPHQVLSERNLTHIQEVMAVLPIWNDNKTNEKIEGKCQSFHKDLQFSTMFFYWPEDNPLFDHCCTDINPFSNDGNDLPPNLRYKYSRYGLVLQYGIYRDVGYIDQCLPFWKCQNTYLKLIFDTNVFFAYCERTDLTKLYRSRFWKLTLWKYSLVQTILPWIPFLEVIVSSMAVAIFPFTMTWRLAPGNPAKLSRWKYLVPTSKIWLASIWKRLLMDWGHLYLLAVVGNGLMEATRHQSLYTIQSNVLFDYSMLYLVLFIMLSIASALQQLAYWIGCATEWELVNWTRNKNEDSQPTPDVRDNRRPRSGADARENGHINSLKVSFSTDKDHPSHGDIESNQAESIDDEQAIGHLPQDEISILGNTSKPLSIKKRTSFGAKLGSASKKLSLKKIRRTFRKNLSGHVFSLKDDYKWQPIAAQTAIVFTLGSFLTFTVNDDSNASDMWGTELGYIVTAGCLWTGIYTTVVFFQRAKFIFTFFMKLWDDTNSPREHSSSERHVLEFQGPYVLNAHTISSAQFKSVISPRDLTT